MPTLVFNLVLLNWHFFKHLYDKWATRNNWLNSFHIPMDPLVGAKPAVLTLFTLGWDGTHRQVHVDVWSIQQQHAAGDGGPGASRRRDVYWCPPGHHSRRVYNLLLVGQEKGVPGYPSAPSPLPVPLVPLSRLEADPRAAAERPAQKAHHLPGQRQSSSRRQRSPPQGYRLALRRRFTAAY